jgi:hypothetical protein
MANTKYDNAYTKKLTCSSSDQSEYLSTSKNEVYLIADGDCYINFDAAVTSTNRMLLQADTYLKIDGVQVSQLHYLADSGTPAIYVMAFKSP